MNHIVTGLCAVLSFILCILSHLYIDEKKLNDKKIVSQETEADISENAEVSDSNAAESEAESKENRKSETHAGLLTMFVNKIKDLNVKQWVIVAISIILVSGSCFWVQMYDNITWMAKVKVCITLEMLLSAMIIDIYIKKIPNLLIVSAYILRCVLFIPEFIFFKDDFFVTLLGSLIGFAVSFIIFYILSLITRGGIGMGDVKLISAMGFLIGIAGTFYSLFYGMFICMITAVCFLVSRKRKLKDQFPFGPFIFLGFIVAVFLGTF